MAKANSALRRGYVVSGGALVHYREAGNADAPVVVMLHDSPRSSRLHDETMRVLGRRFRVVGLDTPGYGNSDPLALSTPVIEDFGKALAATLAALGLEGAPLYATHTSAKIALAYVDHAQHSGLTTPCLLVLDGLSMPETLASADFIAAYMRPFEIDDAGAYLAREWSRTRDMLRWFPWFTSTPDKRIAMEAPSPEWMADYLIDLMSAGPAYSSAYGAAMRYDPAPALGRVTCPTLVAARADDVLHGFLPRAQAVGSAQVQVQSLPANREAWLTWLEGTLAEAPAFVRAPAAQAEQAAMAYVDLPHGQMRITRHGDHAHGPAALVIGAPTALHAHAWAQALAPHMASIVPELPGLGESDALPGATAEAMSDALAAMLRAIGAGPVAVVAIGWAAPIGALLAGRHPDLVRALAVDGAPSLDAASNAAIATRLCPDFAFDAQGGSHLHRIWHYLRDGEAQWPWFDLSQAAMRRLPPLFDGAALHDALTAMLKQPAYWGDAARAALALADPAAAWAAVRVPTLAFAHADPAFAHAASLAELASDAHTHPRPDSMADTARAFAAFCAGTQVSNGSLNNSEASA